jgi:hypothetical protein
LMTMTASVTELTFFTVFFGFGSVLLLTAKTFCCFTERTLHFVSPTKFMLFRSDGIIIVNNVLIVKLFYLV